MLSLRSSTAAAVLVWASAFLAADPAAHAQTPAPADPAAPPPVEPLPPPDPALLAPPPPPPAPEPPKEEKPAAPDRVSVGKKGGFFQPGAFIQVFALATKVDDVDTATTFRLRRIEVHSKGEILPKLLSYRVLFDVAKAIPFNNTNVPVNTGDPAVPSPGTVAVPQPGADRSALQDAWMTFHSEYADVTIGQFKVPVSLEALQPGARLLFPERSRVTAEYGDRRDIGIKVDKKIGEHFYYNVGIFNGQGQTVIDSDQGKDLALRLEAYPIAGLLLGAAAYGTVGEEDTNVVRRRVEGDLRFELNDFIVQGEYIRGWTGTKARRLEGHGAYGQVAYTIAGKLQPAARVGFLDVNLDDLPPANVAEGGTQRSFELAANYLVNGYDAKLTAAFGLFAQENGPDTKVFTLQAIAQF